MSILLSNLANEAQSFKINSDLMCEPQFAAKSAISDLSHTENQIRVLTRPQISTFPNAVLKNRNTEIVSEPIKLHEFKELNPCNSKPLTTFYSPKSFSDLRTIVKNSNKVGTAIFAISYDFLNRIFASRSNLQISAGNCPEPDRHVKNWAEKIVGCLSLDKPDKVYCCPRPLLYKNFSSFGFKALCEGKPTHSETSERLSAKKLALYLGLKLVKTTLPTVLKQAIKLRSFLSWPKNTSRLHDPSKWSVPTPALGKSKRRCLPVKVDLFHSPPTFKNISLVRPQDYTNFEENVDTLTEYIDYLELANKKLKENHNVGHLRLQDNDITAYDWIISMFSKKTIIFTLPTAFMAIFSLIVCLCSCSHIKLAYLKRKIKNKPKYESNSSLQKTSA